MQIPVESGPSSPVALDQEALSAIVGGAATSANAAGNAVPVDDDGDGADAALKKLPGKRKPPTLTLK